MSLNGNQRFAGEAVEHEGNASIVSAPRLADFFRKLPPGWVLTSQLIA